MSRKPGNADSSPHQSQHIANLKLVLCIAALSSGIALSVGMTSCGGSSPSAPATISSFAANPTSVTAGASASLTGSFSGGTGVITPGNLPATSGTALSVSPATTTTYTLTVTPSSSTAVAATATATVTVYPAPAIASFSASPSTITAGASVSLTALFTNGTGVITPGNQAVISGAAVSVSPTATTTYTLTVTNPSGTAITQSATVTVNPVPAATITSLSPSSATATGDAFSLTVNGTGFLSGATVQWTGSSLSTTFGNSTQLIASVPASLVKAVGSASITVINPGAAASNAVSFPINQPEPVITSLSPTSAAAGGAAFTLTVNGTGFFLGATVEWNSTPLPTTFVSPTQMTATVASTLITSQGTATVTVSSSGVTSNPESFTINPPVPGITSLSPISTAAGGGDFTLTVNGTGLLSGATVQWNGTPLTTTFVSSTQLTASVSASLITAIGSAQVAVTNPDGAVSNFGTFFMTGWVTLATVNWELDNDETLTLNSDGSWSIAISGDNLPYGIPGNAPQQSGTNWAGFSQQASYPQPGTIASITDWNVQVISGTAPRSCCIGSGSNPNSSISAISYTPTSVSIRGTDYIQNRVTFTLQIQYLAIPLASGYVNPKYLIMGVTYAPPGGGTGSYVSYQNSTTVGNTSTNSSSFSNGVTLSIGLTGGVNGFLAGQGTTTLSSGWMQKTSSSTSVTISKTNSTTFKTPGVPTAYSPVNHDYDLIWLWLNPVSVFSAPADPSAGNFTLWNGYGFDLADPLQDVDVWPIYVGYLNGDFGPLSAQDADVLSRSWVTTQSFAPGGGPGITSADYPNILGADPFAYNPYDANTGYQLVLDSTSNPPTSTDGRFTALQVGSSTPQSIPYPQAPLDSATGEQETYQLQNQTQTITKQISDYTYTVGFGLEAKYSANFLGFASGGGDLKASWNLTWENSSETDISNQSTQTDMAQITGPPCPALAPPCNPQYSEPHEFALYQDNLYGTFMFWPNPYFSISSLVPSTDTIAAGGTATYVISTLAQAGYAGSSLTFSVTGLPSGVTYNQGPVAPGNAFGLDVVTAPTTPQGTYPLTISATDGSQSYFAYATLVVN